MLKGAEFLVKPYQCPGLGRRLEKQNAPPRYSTASAPIVTRNAGEQLHHGAFARAILANEAMDFSRAEVKVNVFQGDPCHNAWKLPATPSWSWDNVYS
jgi:hypothetical protein